MTGTRSGRLVGLDVARCLALLGMVATHVLDERTPAGDLTTGQWLAGGRASALFAVLAGVSLALMTREPLRGRPLALRAAGITGRALVIGLLGLLLGGLDTGIAIILTYYGVLFVLGLPFTLLGVRALLPLTVAWVALAPVVSHLVRPHLPERGSTARPSSSSPTPGSWRASCSSPATTPSFPWLAYLLAGLALGPRRPARHRAAGRPGRRRASGRPCSRPRSRGRWSTRRWHRENATGMFGDTPGRRRLGLAAGRRARTRRRRSTSPRRSAARSCVIALLPARSSGCCPGPATVALAVTLRGGHGDAHALLAARRDAHRAPCGRRRSPRPTSPTSSCLLLALGAALPAAPPSAAPSRPSRRPARPAGRAEPPGGTSPHLTAAARTGSARARSRQHRGW